MFGRLPGAGGLDDQPLERLTRMAFAERVRALFAKRAASRNWAEDLTPGDLALMRLLYEEAD